MLSIADDYSLKRMSAPFVGTAIPDRLVRFLVPDRTRIGLAAAESAPALLAVRVGSSATRFAPNSLFLVLAIGWPGSNEWQDRRTLPDR